MQPELSTKLYRSYCLHGAATRVTRHRGKSPRQTAFFFKNPEVTFHAAQLASLFLIYDLLGAASGVLESRYRAADGVAAHSVHCSTEWVPSFAGQLRVHR